ncbi:MAG: UDP-glucose 4-epimerase GalE [Pseudomonadota bacterium]
MSKRLIVTGGAGYIGSHVCVTLLEAGNEVLVIDNLDNSSAQAIERIEQITGKTAPLLRADLSDPSCKGQILDAVKAFKPTGAIHLAGLKAVGDSVAQPMRYYRNNIEATWTLLEALEQADAKRLVFSSSATVYGDLNQNPVQEDGATGPTNPYGRTKLFIEEMLKDLAHSDSDWRICNLRYFNPVGAHASGKIGEDPTGVPNNLFPFIAQVAVGRRPKVNVYGNDYPTPDGTGVRDYIHVDDLAKGHMAAIHYLDENVPNDGANNTVDINLGCGKGVSVLQAIEAFRNAANREIAFEIASRRPGDVAEIVANAGKAAALLNWKTEKTLEDMCQDHWRWQQQNPNGYDTDS